MPLWDGATLADRVFSGDPMATQASYEMDQTHTNINDTVLTGREVFEGYKSQSSVEGGFRFLKDPLFFVSSLFLKKPSRIEALLMVMTLALFVYTIAQR